MTFGINDIQHNLSAFMVSIIMLRLFKCYADCHNAEYRYAECLNAECRYSVCCYAVCHYVDCCDYLNVMLSIVMLSVLEPSIVYIEVY